MTAAPAAPRLAEWLSHTAAAIPLSIGDMLRKSAALWPEQEAVVFSHQPLIAEVRWTFAALDRQATLLAERLLAFGYQPGDRIAILGPNHPEWILLEYALAKAGLVLVALNPLYKKDELIFTLNDSAVCGLFYADRIGGALTVDVLAEVRAHTPLLRSEHSFSVGIPALLDGAAVPVALPVVDPAALFMIQYTSGTTGKPKAVHISHAAIVTTAHNAWTAWGLGSSSRVCHGFPLFHIGGSGHATPAAAVVGASTHPLYIFKASIALDILEHERCDTFIGVPTMLIAMLDEPGLGARNFTALKTVIVGGASVTSDLVQRCKQAFGAEVLNGYGQTETCGVTACTTRADSADKKISTCGRALTGVSIAIIDSAGHTVERNQIGQLHYQGPGRMLGYQEAGSGGGVKPSSGWMPSGDLAIMDDAGYIKIVGRAKEMIIRGGENISPLEVESYMLEHPAIRDVAVVGLYDEKYGEELCAAIRLVKGATVTGEEVRQWCAARISRWKVPKYVAIVEEFPLTPSGKIKKFILRQQMEHLFGLQSPTPSPHLAQE